MGIDDLGHTGLVLGLGLSLSSSSTTREIKSKKTNLGKIIEPSLTLSLSGETFNHHQIINQNPVKKLDFDYTNKVICSNNDLYGQDSTTSSLISNVSVKREREIGCDEVEIERVSSRASDEDDDGSNGRKKLRLTKAQSALLEESFKQQSTLNPKQKQDLARELKLRPRQVEVWFQNRRARTKLKQTEVDCELLKKYCDTLSDENRRLQNELNELKLAKPVYMAATLTMCPSCERLAPENAAAKLSRFNMAPKPHFYNPFTNPSAAC